MTKDEYVVSIHDIARDAGLPATLAERLATAGVSGTTLRNAIHDAGVSATAATVLSHPGLSGQLRRGEARASSPASAPASAPAAPEPRRAPKVTASRVSLPPIPAPTPPAPPPKPSAMDQWREAARRAGVPLKDPE